MSDPVLDDILKQLKKMREIPSTALALRDAAVQDSVAHIRSDSRFNDVQVHQHNPQALRAGLDATTVEGMVAEFGVYRGDSLEIIAGHFSDTVVHGFDTFTGLPEAWSGKGAGAFDIGGTPPQLPHDNVEYHVGLFSETLPGFAADHEGPFAFCHLDADLYESTRIVFDQLRSWFVPGTVIVLDEYFGYHGWQQHEHLAFMELLDAADLTFEAIAIGHMNLAVRLATPS